MKARIQGQKQLTLSIGMIVKNEEENLEKCLEGLKPLLEAVDSELVIVDTGSTDSTMEIARRYTDKVYEFEWDNDFSAARNATLDHSVGQWYMYIDADEWLNDCEELIAFFTSEKDLEEYKSATFIIRNYISRDMQGHNDFYAARIAKRYPAVRFKSKIHEYIERYGPTKTLRSFAHHFGYIQDREDVNLKTKRNLPILLEMWENGTSQNPAHTCFQLSREYGHLGESEKAIDFCRKGIEALQPQNVTIRCGLYHGLVMGLYYANRWEEALEAAKEYLTGKTDEYTVELDIHFFCAGSWMKLSNQDKAIEEYDEYFRMLKLYDEDKINLNDRSVTAVFSMESSYRNAVLLDYADLLKGQRPEDALQTLDKVDSWVGVDLHRFAAIESTCVVNLSDWDRYARRYQELTEDQEYYNVFCACLNDLQEQIERAKVGIAQAFTTLQDLNDPYVLLVMLRGDASGAVEQLREKINSFPPKPEALGILYYALRDKVDFEGYIGKIDDDDLSPSIAKFESLPDLGEYVSSYYRAFPTPRTLPGLRWKCALMERLLLQADATFENHMENFLSFCDSLGELTAKIYGEGPREEIFPVIPHGHRFGILMRQARAAEKKGDMPLYLKLLPKAGEVYPYFLSFVKELVSEAQNVGKRQKAIEEESQGLIRLVKDKIQEVIFSGDFATAGKLLNEYKAFNPKDEDIPFLEMQLTDTPYLS